MSAARPRCGRAASLVTGVGKGAARNAPGPLGYLCHVVSESILTGESMRNNVAVLITAVSSAIATAAGAQATGMPSFNAPYRAFQRSEFGGVLSFPDGGGTGFEGVYRYASGKFDIGLRGGFFDPGGNASTVVLAGIEARERVITHTVDFPLDGAIVFGAGAGLVSGGSSVYIPVGLSLGRRVDPQGSQVSIVPYAQPTLAFVVGTGRASDLLFAFGVGADFRLSRAFDARVSGGLGDHPFEGVSIGAVWVH